MDLNTQLILFFPFKNIYTYILFLAASCGLRDPSSPTRDRTWALDSESAKS